MTPYRLGAVGEDLPGVMFALDFLRDVNLGREVDVGRSVVVVGGGNVAIGHGPDLSWMGAAAGVVGDERGWIKVTSDGETKMPGVFAGGDLVNSVADAISAIADGLRAVEGITRLAEARGAEKD